MAGNRLPPRAPQEAGEADGREAEEAKEGVIPERRGTRRASPRGTRGALVPSPPYAGERVRVRGSSGRMKDEGGRMKPGSDRSPSSFILHPSDFILRPA